MKAGVIVIADPMSGIATLTPSRQAPRGKAVDASSFLVGFFPTRDPSAVIRQAGKALAAQQIEPGKFRVAFPEAFRAVEQAVDDVAAPDPIASAGTGNLVRWLGANRLSYTMMGKIIGQSQSQAHRIVTGDNAASPTQVASLECASDGELRAEDFIPEGEPFSLSAGRFAGVFMMALVEKRTGTSIRNLVPEASITAAARAFQATGVLPA